MQVFSTDRSKRKMNDLKYWLNRSLIGGVIILFLKFLLKIPNERIEIAIAVYWLLILADFLVQYHVYEIRVDKEENRLIILLNSRISGQKEKQYSLGTVAASFEEYRGVLRHSKPKKALVIYCESRDKYTITDRYGFSEETLKQVGLAIPEKRDETTSTNRPAN